MNFDERAKELVANIADLEESDEDYWVSRDAAMHELRAAYVAGLRRGASIAATAYDSLHAHLDGLTEEELGEESGADKAAELITDEADKVERGEL
jgi:hypothetical protein